MPNRSALRQLEPHSAFEQDACRGLSARPKQLAPKYFYDAKGSELFERITELPEYYPTRTELALLREQGLRLAELLSSNSMLVEFGAGSGLKAELLLRHMERPAGYMAIEISATALEATETRLRMAFPNLPLRMLEADFVALQTLPQDLPGERRVGFFPGSTIGNMTPIEALAFLRTRRRMLGRDARFVLGVDLAKDSAILLPAYDDAQGVTAAFNLNLINRLNRELNAGLDPSAFRHEARWNAAESRIEMHLVATRPQRARIGGRTFAFAMGESLHTENSYKYEPSRFQALAEAAGWSVLDLLTDAQGWFGVFMLSAA